MFRGTRATTLSSSRSIRVPRPAPSRLAWSSSTSSTRRIARDRVIRRVDEVELDQAKREGAGRGTRIDRELDNVVARVPRNIIAQPDAVVLGRIRNCEVV